MGGAATSAQRFLQRVEERDVGERAGARSGGGGGGSRRLEGGLRLNWKRKWMREFSNPTEMRFKPN